MPRMFNPGGPSNPGWSLGDLGGETYQGPANAGSNNFAAGPLNGQTLGNNNFRPKNGGPRGLFPSPWTGGAGGGVMPNLNNSVGNASMAGAPSWAVGNWGNETWVGPANAGSNNYGAGPLNGQTMGNNNGRPKSGGRMPGGFSGPEAPGAQNSFGTDAFGFPISSQSQASGAGLQQLNAYRDYNQAVQNWINQTGFTGEGGYSAFQLANPNWTSKYGAMGPTGANQSGSGFGSGQPWTPGANFGQMPNGAGQMVNGIGSPAPAAGGMTMGTNPVAPGMPSTGGVKPSQPVSTPTGLTTGTTWGSNGGR